MPGPLIWQLGRTGKGWDGPGPAAAPALLEEGRTSQKRGSGSSVGKARGWQEGACGKDQAGGAGRTPVGTLVVPLVPCVALGKLFDLFGRQIKEGYIRDPLCIKG